MSRITDPLKRSLSWKKGLCVWIRWWSSYHEWSGKISNGCIVCFVFWEGWLTNQLRIKSHFEFAWLVVELYSDKPYKWMTDWDSSVIWSQGGPLVAPLILNTRGSWGRRGSCDHLINMTFETKDFSWVILPIQVERYESTISIKLINETTP